MSQPSEFIEAPGEGFGGGEATVELVPAFLADWLRGEAEGFEGELAPEVLVKRDLAKVHTGCTKAEDI